MKQQGFDDQHEKEGRQLIWIFCLYFVVLVLAIVAITFCFRENWGWAAGTAGTSFLMWRVIKFAYGDEWNV
jgi:hypothetical protein